MTVTDPKIHKFFPVDVVEYQHTADLTSVISLLEAETFKEHSAFSSVKDLHNDLRYSLVFDFINASLEDYRKGFKFDCDQFEISSSWANHSLPNSGQNHKFHRHSMSLLSGVYYFTAGAALGFEDPMTPRVMNQLEVLRFDYTPFMYIDPAPGKLVIFPSWLYHWTKPHVDNFDRWNIAFNVLPTGKINYNMATDSTAHIQLINNRNL
jgi:uncharacterized protein (TIGR02466 family)